MITVDAMHNKSVSVHAFPSFVSIDIEDHDSMDVMTSNVPNAQAAELARDVARATGTALDAPEGYEAALELLLERLANAVNAAGNEALWESLAMLGVGFIVDDSPATQEVVKALVGAV